MYKANLEDAFPHLPRSAFRLLGTLLSLHPADRGTAAAALKSDVSTVSLYQYTLVCVCGHFTVGGFFFITVLHGKPVGGRCVRDQHRRQRIYGQNVEREAAISEEAWNSQKKGLILWFSWRRCICQTGYPSFHSLCICQKCYVNDALLWFWLLGVCRKWRWQA